MKRIEFVVKDKTYGIPNAWELLTPEQYMDAVSYTHLTLPTT